MPHEWSPAELDPEKLHWSDASDEVPNSRFLAPLAVGPAMLHLEARRVVRDDEYFTLAEWPEDLDALDALYSETRFRVVDGPPLGLPPGEYLLFAYPYGE